MSSAAFGVALAACGVTLAHTSVAKDGEVPLLLGGPVATQKPAIILDGRLPRGPRFGAERLRPELRGEPAGCSLERPVCVHRGPGVSAATASVALGAIELAYTRLVLALGLPAPASDRGAGGSDALDWYLVADGPGDNVSAHDAPEHADFDRAPAYCVLEGAERAHADRAATLCVAEAIAWRLDASLTPDLRRAYATHLWWTVGLPTPADVQAIDGLQDNPELAIAQRERDEFSEGRALLFEYLDTRRSVAGPAVLSTGLVALGASTTPVGALEWHNEPDLFDVLRHTLAENRGRFAALLGDFAVARAFAGDRDDGTHLPSLAYAGSFGRVRHDWVLPFSTLPRRVVSARPLEPNGALYVYVPIDGPAAATKLGFRASWEPPAAFQWILVRLDRAGHELTRFHVPYQDRATTVEAQVTELDGVAAVLVVGTNLDGVDLGHPFDPDVAPFEPHRAVIYVARLD